MHINDKLPNYIVVGSKSWNKKIFENKICRYPGNWKYLDMPDQITVANLAEFYPKFIFFLHWSYLVPESITKKFNCVCFHMTDVPFGRGGSPLQNLIIRGFKQTKLSALKMVRDFDAGPVYLKSDLSLDGSAEEIYIRATELSAEIIYEIIMKNPVPSPQKGKPVIFKRRRPEQSKIPKLDSAESLYDFIRMLDADGYPKAFLLHKGYRYEFSNAALKDGSIRTEVIITQMVDHV